MSLAVAFGIGGVALPSVANAAVPAVPTTVQLTVPTQLSNTGTPDGTGTLKITTGNNTTGASTIPDPAHTKAHIAITGPSGLSGSQVTLNIASYGPVPLSGTGGNLSADVPIDLDDITAGHVDDNSYTLSVNSPTVTGTLTTVVTLQHYNASSAVDSNLAVSNTGTTALVAPSAPTFNAAPPAATIYHSYSYTLAPAVFPAVDPADGWTVYQKHTTTATIPVTTYTMLDSANCDPPNATQTCIDLGQLDNGQPALLFNATTRVISGTAAGLNKAIPNPDSYVFTADNGVSTGVATDNAATPWDEMDSSSMTATIPVLFSDVAFADTFGPAIYSLAGQMPNTVIQGYADGTFRPNLTVTRQAFVHFAAQVINNAAYAAETPAPVSTGVCSPFFEPTSFSDVPNNSTFCKEIRDLNTLGVVNGYSDGTFGPTNIVSRQAIAAFLYRVDMVVKGLNANTQGDAQCTGSAPFNDVAVTDQFCGDISWMVDNDIADGYPDGGFHPLAGSSRQATAQFFYNLEILEGTVTP